ncbi:MAG TPA: fumarylacetoacetate hydrolase family protein, partial [Candidatus Dormibacteraeota bacterium]|nr:fumarylacetoacetate hydrolase family protein [Candidatus Dormibacteraeota bacterium]
AISDSAQRFPVHRIYCVSRNYADGTREISADPPGFFLKPGDAVVANGSAVPYPPRTSNCQHEIELVLAIGREGRDISEHRALEYVFGYAVGLDLTRRDLQRAAKQWGQPQDTAKAFDWSAPVAAIRPASVGHIVQGRIWLSVNDRLRQDADVKQMLWNPPHIIAELSTFYELKAGDLIFCGTPSGVGTVWPGDRLEGGVEGLELLRISISGAKRAS